MKTTIYHTKNVSQPSIDIDWCIPQIATLETRLHTDSAWSLHTITETIADPYTQLLCIFTESADGSQQVIAYCIYQALFEHAEIYRIGTNPNYQQQGYAIQLLTELYTQLLEQDCEQLILEVRADNKPAIALYHKHNFQQISRRPHYYVTSRGAIDALIMQKTL